MPEYLDHVDKENKTVITIKTSFIHAGETEITYTSRGLGIWGRIEQPYDERGSNVYDAIIEKLPFFLIPKKVRKAIKS